MEENLKTAIQIYLLSVTGGVSVSEEQMETLRDLAEQSPVIYGEGVYIARAILNLDVLDSTEAPRPAPSSTQPTTELLNPIGTFYPNPTSDRIDFEYKINENEEGVIFVKDLFGRIVLK
jgi:hypothetical protein